MLINAKTKIVSPTITATEIEGFTLSTETPVAAGGTGQFPPATRMVIAAFLNCSFSTLRSFCEKRNIATEGLSMDFSGHYEDGVYKEMIFTVNLPDSFDEKYYDSLEKVFAACSVRKIMKNLPDIQIAIA